MRSGGRGSLIGVIVSHVMVLFDFIEEQHERGENLRDALIRPTPWRERWASEEPGHTSSAVDQKKRLYSRLAWKAGEASCKSS